MAIVWMILAQFVWMPLYKGEIVNIARGKPVNMSSRHDDATYPPEKGVDGITIADISNIIHTLTSTFTPAWWWVDLQTQVQDATVTIYFRTDAGRLRRNGVQLYTSTTFSTNPVGQLCHKFTDTNISDVDSWNCTGSWRYLLVYKTTKAVGNTDKGPVLDFGEVEVLGCNGTYGVSCDKSCSSRHCARTSTSCDRYTGECPGGCQAGWMGTDCTQECSSGMYGANCTKSCSSRHCTTNSTTCNRVSGICPGGCTGGWRGTDCMEECSSGMYGANCTKSCSSRQCTTHSTTCKRVSGLCPGGCTGGWRGTDCMEECSSGMYGANCTQSCSSRHCAKNSSTCNKVSGLCPEGCKAGWRGTNCMEECSIGMYGANCTKSCSSRQCATNSTTCERVSGLCPGGCQAGWSGTDCMEECPDGKYGINCGSICISRHCAVNTSTCNRTTGECPLTAGCTPGWRGIDCSQTCVDTYGRDCTMSCGDRKCKGSSTSCDHVTGECVDGCKPGWNGTDCIHECPNKTYGEDCSKNCVSRECLTSSDTCDHVTGACAPRGCEPGWNGTDCSQSVKEQTDNIVVPAVAGAVAGVLVIVIVVIVIIIYRRRKRTPSHEKYEETGKNSFADAAAAKRTSNEVNNVYVNVEQVQPKIERVKSGSSQPNVPADPEQEEEIPDEGEASPSTDYYNESDEVIREVAVADLAATIQKIKQREGGFATEYSRLSTGFTASYDDSQKPENAGKNKFRGLYPYDHNRVRLSTLPDVPGSDYINASLMHSYDQKKAYIAAQAPNKKTVGDFWRMIWEQRCGRVIMLTSLVEEAKVKCYQYWPEEDVLETDHHRVEVEVTDTRADYTIRRLKVTSKTNGDNRTVVQYHYTSWPDHGVPDTLALVNFIWMIRRTGTPRDGPLLVHCSAGIGRTGTYIAVDSLLDQARNEGKVDVLGYVSTMRGQRKNMIQTKEQYECVFQCLLEMTAFGNTSMDVENFITSYSSRGMDSMVDRKTIREITQMMRTRDRRDSPGRHRMWVDGNQKFIVRVGPTLKHLKGYLQTVAPPAGLEKLLWKLVEENDVQNVIIVSPIQVNLVGETGGAKKYGEIEVTTIGQTNLTSDLALVTLQLKATNAEKSQTVKLFKCAGSNTVEGMSRHLLDHSHFHRLSDEMSPVVLIHSEPNHKGVVYLCIMGNILAGILKDRCVDVIGHVRTVLKCCPDVTLTEGDVEKLLEFSQKCIEMTESTNTYANL